MSARASRHLGLLLLGLLIGCSWFVDPLEDDKLRCAIDAGYDGCPQGMMCGREGVCVTACIPVAEICGDGIDNDCDGLFDEEDPTGRDFCGDHIDNDCDGDIDEDADQDEDGFSWCGDSLDKSVPRDCDDELAERNPGLTEVCDNLDNDCDGIPDNPKPGQKPLCEPGQKCEGGVCMALTCANDPTFKCPPGTACSVSTASCQPVPLGCAGITCPAGQECRNGTCQAKPKEPNGRPCLVDGDCLSGSCIDGAALRLPNLPRVCARACCNQAQCGEGETCFAAGTGARSCLPSAMVPTTVQPRQCTNDTFCGRDVCALEKDQSLEAPPFSTTSNLTTSVCQAPDLDARGLGGYCPSGANACKSHTCVTGAYAGLICSKPCGHSGECADFARVAPFAPANQRAHCRYIPVRQGEPGRTPDYASVCMLVREDETGMGEQGAACMSPGDCRDRGCVGAAPGRPGKCAMTCCDNSQCVSESRPPGTCRPFKFGMGYEMRCDDTVAPTRAPTSAESR